MGITRITAPNTMGLAVSTSYLGGDAEFYVQPGARRVVVWFNDAENNVKGVVKYRVDRGHTVEFTVPADNGVILVQATDDGPCLPQIQIDAKSASGTPTFYLTVT